jgi:hypothetical protein
MMLWGGGSPQPYTQYPTVNALQPYYPPQQAYPPQSYLTPPPGLGFPPYYIYPMTNAFYPYHPPPAVALAPAPATSDKKGNRQKGNKKHEKGQTQPKEKTGTPNTTLPRTSLARPSKLHVYCHFHVWVTTWVAIRKWRALWQQVSVYEVSSFRVHPC